VGWDALPFQHTNFLSGYQGGAIAGWRVLGVHSTAASGYQGGAGCGIGAFVASLDDMVNAALKAWFPQN